MHEYSRAVFYYETDKMGVVHHSNFVRWLEEARVDYMRAAGAPLEDMEAEGVLCPVIGLDVKFKHFARFGERFTVKLRVLAYNGVKLNIGYSVENDGREVILTAESEHCFVDSGYRAISIKKRLPRFHEAFLGGVGEGDSV